MNDGAARSRSQALRWLVMAVALLLMTSGCATESGGADTTTIEIRSAFVDRPANPTLAAVRMTIDNTTGEDDTLVAVASADAARASVHRSGTDDDGRSTMEPVERLELPAGQTVEFAPGGLHVMLEDPIRDLEIGDEISLTLTFERSGTQTISVPVVEPGTTADEMEAHRE